jgi:SAM-dependent methyltransferase
MTDLTVRPTVADLVSSFVNAPQERLSTQLSLLVAAVWEDGEVTGLAADAVPVLVAALDQAAPRRQGYLAFLLGLLAEAGGPAAGEIHAAVRGGLDRYLDLLPAGAADQPLTLALLYLVSHLPEDRDRILAAVSALELGDDDLSRLDRVLRPLDPATAVLGRVWPSPAAWTLTDEEREFDRSWISRLSPSQLTAAWDGDTRQLLGYSGAKAYWALRNGDPAQVTDSSRHRDIAGDAAVDVADTRIDAIARYGPLLRCPACHGHLDFRDGVRCAGCGSAYSAQHGVLDLSASAVAQTVDAAREDPDDVLKNAATLQKIGLYYETVLRPAFLRLMGSNWGGAVSPADEDEYLGRCTSPVDGPVLDLAAGAGRWTAVLAELLGPERVIALDLNLYMLTWLRGRLPAAPALRASALDIPVRDATLGAVNCWNALQTLPEPAKAIAEVGRCLRPGGTFTLLTFGRAADPIYRYFQASFRGPGFPHGMPLFDLDELTGWLNDAGMVVREISTPGTFIFITAERAA